MRPKGKSPKELEVRRRKAVRYLCKGKSLSEVADELGVSPSSVHRWKEAYNRGGLEALKAKPHPAMLLT